MLSTFVLVEGLPEASPSQFPQLCHVLVRKILRRFAGLEALENEFFFCPITVSAFQSTGISIIHCQDFDVAKRVELGLSAWQMDQKYKTRVRWISYLDSAARNPFYIMVYGT